MRKSLACLPKRAWKTASIERRKQGQSWVREKIPTRLVLKQHPFELRQSHLYLLRLLVSLLQLSSCRLFAGFSPLSTTFLKKLLYYYWMEPLKKGPVSNTLVFSLIALPFAFVSWLWPTSRSSFTLIQKCFKTWLIRERNMSTHYLLWTINWLLLWCLVSLGYCGVRDI